MYRLVNKVFNDPSLTAFLFLYIDLESQWNNREQDEKLSLQGGNESPMSTNVQKVKERIEEFCPCRTDEYVDSVCIQKNTKNGKNIVGNNLTAGKSRVIFFNLGSQRTLILRENQNNIRIPLANDAMVILEAEDVEMIPDNSDISDIQTSDRGDNILLTFIYKSRAMESAQSRSDC